MTFNFFIKKTLNIKNYDFSNVVARYGATGFFTENRAVSPFFIYEFVILGQILEKSLERLSGKVVLPRRTKNDYFRYKLT